MLIRSFAKVVLLAFAAACISASAHETATMFAPGTISDGGLFGLTLSPDGRHALGDKSGGTREKLWRKPIRRTCL